MKETGLWSILGESVLGGVLRGIEFIYGEPGVNWPLKADDDEKKNLNKTKYRNKINKVANAIKELITGMGQYIPQQEEVSREILWEYTLASIYAYSGN
jgi:hypothetical protein